MVSPQNQCSSSSTTRIQRSIGHSRRTFRSHFYDADRSCSFSAASDDLTDSIVDFHLRELAAVPAPSLSPKADSSVDMLDVSQDFSDFHSFGSDISGELERLALVPPPGAYGDDVISGVDAHSGVSVGEDRGSMKKNSSEMLETVATESVGPIVSSCVQILENAHTTEGKNAAAARLRLLAKNRSDFRTLIGKSGAIPALVPLLRSADPVLQENAVTALLNLSLEEPNKAPVTAAGAIKPLVYALKTGTAVAKQNAACALLSLSMIEDNRDSIGTSGAIPPLVSLLINGNSRGKKDALTTLYKLCSTRQNKDRAVRAGAVAPLVGMVVEHGAGVMEKAMVVLSSLAGVREGREAIVEEGGIQVLVETLEDGSAKAKEFAVLALLQLCSDSVRNRALLVREGAIPPLVALSQSGSVRAKQKAETLLGYLREQRQEHETEKDGDGCSW